MMGERANVSRCPVCGGRLEPGLATIPLVLSESVVLIKDVPAEICRSCHEPYTSGAVTDRIAQLLNQLAAVRAEVSVIAYSPQPAPALATTVGP